MLSRNNWHLQEQKMRDSKQRFSIRKYSFGAASVLLGLSFMTYAEGNPVSADTTDQPAVTVTETKTTSTDKASTAQTTAVSEATPSTATGEASSTATSEAAKQTSEAVSSTATSESAAAETTPSSETASKETVTSKAAKESTATSEASKTSTATSEASEKASTATSESTTPATATSEEISQEQSTSSETADTNALTASKVAKTSALKSVKLAATTTTTTDVAASSSGEITGNGKAKGLTDSDVTPGMSDANGAQITADQSDIPKGYEADPTEGRFTFGILSLGPVSASDLHSYNQLYSTNYYIRMSVATKGSNGTYDDTIHLQLVDADKNTVLWEKDAKPGDAAVDIDALKKTDPSTWSESATGKPFQYSYTETTLDGVTSKGISITSNIGPMYSINVYEAGSVAKNAQATALGYNYPSKSTIETRYIAKDAAGNETVLATYDKTGRVGYKYTVSGNRDFVGYDLVSSPSSTTDSLKSTYKVGDVYLSSVRNLSDSLKWARVQIITSKDGTSRIQFRVAVKKDADDLDVSDLNDSNVWKPIFTTEELKPGEVSNTGNNQMTYNGVTYKNGAFAVNLSMKDSDGGKLGLKQLEAAGFTEDQLAGWNKYAINMTLVNRFPAGQLPVDYYYAPQGQVRVNYVTSNGTVIQAPVIAYKNSGTGTAYDVTGSTYKPETITVNGKTYRFVTMDKSKGATGTDTVNGYTYNVIPSDVTGIIKSNTLNDVYYVYELVTYTLKDPETKTVTRTINYVDSVTGKAIPSELEPSVKQEAKLTRSVIYDDKGNKIGYGTVSADGTSYTLDDSYRVTGSWDEQKSADLSSHGYTAPDKETVEAVNVDGSTKDTVVTVYYGHQTTPVKPTDPKTPGEPINPKGNVTYPEGLTEKDLKDTVTRTINYVDAKGNPVNGSPDGKSSYVQTITFERTAIVDKVTGEILGYDTNGDDKADTDDPNRAWKPLSADLGEVKSTDPKTLGFDHVDKSVVSKETVVPGQADLNEKVVYSNNPMVVSGTIKYVDDTTGVTLDEDVLPSGEVGSTINYTTADKITYYENKGYDLVSNDFKDGTTTYAKEGNNFEVHLKHKTQTITPKDPNPVTPGTPINPEDPNSPVYSSETDRKNLVKDATQTIHYVGAGDKTPKDKVQTQKEAFTRTVTIDKVTGKVLETSAWEGTKTFGFEDTPVVEGYHADKKSEGGLTATPDNPDVEATVTYTPNGKLIPVDEEGVHIKDTDTPTYKTDPTDPTKVMDPTVPEVDGYQPRDNKVGDKVTPKDPAKDTEVVYVKTPETKYGLTEKFVDVDGNELSPSESKGSDYKTGDTYDVTKDAKVITGYVLVDTDETTGTFDKSDKTATFIYKKVGKIIPVDKDNNPIPDADTPTYENDPDDPTKVTPNEPTPTVPGWTTEVPNVTPEDPTKDTPVVYTQNKYGLTEKFVDVDGNELSPSESKGTEYKTGDKYDVTKDAKVINGYVLVDTDETTGTFDKSDKTATFIYKKVGKIIPVDPKGNPIPGADTPSYKNDPDDPTKVTPNEPTPGVPGWKTDVPNVTPEDPTKDKPVPYTKNETPETKYGLLEKFVDEEGNELAESVDKGSDYKTGDKFDVTKDAKVITGYVLVKTEGTTGTFTDSGKLAVFTYKKVGKIVPVDPKGNPIPDADTPTYKNDPDDPSKVVPNEPTPGVPGYKTDVPKITPEDPTKDTPVVYTQDKYGLTEKFVDEEGNELLPSESKGSDYKSGDTYDVIKDAKVITGYVLVKTTDTTGTFDKSDKTAVFTYKKIGKIVPVDPKGNPIPGADTPTYKNDPDDPSKVVPNEPTPGVPGYKTDVPNVTPEDPTKDTPVPYTKNETPAAKYGLTEKFVDENGNDLVPSESKGTDYKSGDKYDVTKDAKVITGYVLVKTTDTTGTFDKSDKTAVFTYKKIGKIVPVDPKGNPIPGADTPTYKNDPDDPTKVTPNEPTPSVPGYKTDVPNVTPEDPTKDTPVPYTKNETPAAKYGLTEKFVDENGNDLVPSESKGTDYKSGDKYDVTKDAKVITGYVLVKTTDTTGTFTDGNKTAVFTYKKLGKIVPVDPKGNPIPGADTPTYKNDPDDPSKVVPNEPTPSVPGYKTDVPKVTPEDPTKDIPVPYTKNETPAAKYGLTEKFVDESGNDLVPSESKGSDYKSGDKYDVTKDAKVITGYVLVKTTDTTGTFGDSDKTAVFTYKKLGKIVPVDPKGNPIPGADTPTYKNDPDDPTKVTPNEPTPGVPGYKTDVPNVTPEDPTKDTPVPYTKNETPAAKYGLTEKFVDENGNDLVPNVSKGTDYKSGDKYDVTKDAKVITGYVLVKTTDTTGTFGDSDKTAVFTYKKIGRIVPVDKDGNPIPGAETPSYKNDSSDPSKVVPNEPTPSVPGYTTDVPSVTPEDPTKDTPVPYTKNVTPSKPSNNKPGKKGAPSAPTGPTSPTLPGSKKGKTAPATPNATAFSTGASKQTASLKQNAQAKLPQTGEATDKSRALSVLGLGVMALTALLGLAIDKKRKN